jgi:energy-coupling factor transport system ATP-binding protein
MPGIIDVEHLDHVYPNGFQALYDINLSLQRGEILAVLGQNGSGKTTLVKHFNGLLRATRGRVLINGEETGGKSIAELSRVVGYVFQNPSHQVFLPTIGQELAFGCRNIDLADDEVDRRVKSVAEEFGLAGKLESSPYDFSSAVRKEVAIASILAMRPEVMVLDEPTTGQDYTGITRLIRLIKGLNAEGQTIVIIAHDMGFIGELGCRSAVMTQGRLIFDGKADELFDREDILTQAGLQPPQVTSVWKRLRSAGIPGPALTVDSLVDGLSPLLQRSV